MDFNELVHAIQTLNNHQLGGRNLTVNEARPQERQREQVRERIAVALAQEDEARIRRDRERWLGEAVVPEVHGRQSVTSRASPVARVSGWLMRRGRESIGCTNTAARMRAIATTTISSRPAAHR